MRPESAIAEPPPTRERGSSKVSTWGSLRSLILRRLAILPLILLGLSLLVFTLNRMVPGDPALIYAGGPERADPAVVEQIRQDWGLDQPIVVQYVRYVGQLVQGDLGWSFSQRDEVTSVLAQRVPATVELSVAALLLGVPLGLGLGVFAAWRQKSMADNAATFFAIGGISVPIFWVGLMLAYLFSVVLGWFPMGGRMPAFSDFESRTGIYSLDAVLQGDFSTLATVLRHLALPAITLAIVPAALIARYARSSFIDVLGENYIRTARAYGISPITIVSRLAAKNAVLPLITVLGLIIPGLLVGTVLVEIVFSWPGVGRFLLDALTTRDYIVVQSVTLLVGVLYVVVNLLADISYALLDPRTRRS